MTLVFCSLDAAPINNFAEHVRRYERSELTGNDVIHRLFELLIEYARSANTVLRQNAGRQENPDTYRQCVARLPVGLRNKMKAQLALLESNDETLCKILAGDLPADRASRLIQHVAASIRDFLSAPVDIQEYRIRDDFTKSFWEDLKETPLILGEKCRREDCFGDRLRGSVFAGNITTT